MTFLIYIFIGIPIFTSFYVIITRKKFDIDLGTFFGMILVSCLPFLREFILILLIINMIDSNKIVFKKK